MNSPGTAPAVSLVSVGTVAMIACGSNSLLCGKRLYLLSAEIYVRVGRKETQKFHVPMIVDCRDGLQPFESELCRIAVSGDVPVMHLSHDKSVSTSKFAFALVAISV